MSCHFLLQESRGKYLNFLLQEWQSWSTTSQRTLANYFLGYCVNLPLGSFLYPLSLASLIHHLNHPLFKTSMPLPYPWISLFDYIICYPILNGLSIHPLNYFIPGSIFSSMADYFPSIHEVNASIIRTSIVMYILMNALFPAPTQPTLCNSYPSYFPGLHTQFSQLDELPGCPTQPSITICPKWHSHSSHLLRISHSPVFCNSIQS